ncbi:MAG: hypothetical protein HC862_18655 [Scytonema sp. RU_4_4]|nr:hypothetical protein [Scytonema sp. RU_4_4]
MNRSQIVGEPVRWRASTAGGYPTPDALLGETRQVLQRREPPQRSGSPRRATALDGFPGLKHVASALAPP